MPEKKKLEEMINPQSAARKGARQVWSNKNLVSYVSTHDRLHLTGKRPQQRSQGPQQQQSTPSYGLLTTTFEWRSLTTGGTCIIQASRPRGRSHSQCCCVAFPGAVIVLLPPPRLVMRALVLRCGLERKEKEVSILRGPAQLADLQGALCVPIYNLTLATSISMYVCTCTYRNSINKCTTTMIPTAVPCFFFQ